MNLYEYEFNITMYYTMIVQIETTFAYIVILQDLLHIYFCFIFEPEFQILQVNFNSVGKIEILFGFNV